VVFNQFLKDQGEENLVFSNINSEFLVQIISTKDIIRSRNLESKLVDMGLSFKVSPGVVPNQIDFHAGSLHATLQSRLLCQRNLSIGEVGCALAHRKAIGTFLSSDLKYGIVFEDDAEIIADFNFGIMTKLLDSNFPVIIALGWIQGFAIAKNLKDVKREEPVELLTSPTCAFAYALNRSAAKLMINNHEKIIDLADWPIFALKKVKFYCINANSPWVTANHDPKYSIIGERSASISESPNNVLVSRMRLASSLIILVFLSITNKLGASPKQVVHRLLIRDMLYKYGKSQSIGVNRNIVIHAPLRLQKLLNAFGLI
jgi:GR25 family glycosyltransferase involved in LPS biosynthesis